MDALPPARTAGVVNRFSEPVEVEKKQIDERDDRGMEEVAAPLDKDPDPETDGVGGASPFVQPPAPLSSKSSSLLYS